MQIVIAILLYLNYLVAPGSYSQTYVDQLSRDHEYEINQVEQSPDQMDVVNTQDMPLVDQIIITDTGETY